MYIIPLILAVLVAAIVALKSDKEMLPVAIMFFVLVLTTAGIVGFDYSRQTMTTEVWSGVIEKVEHKEEWDEWHPPKTETETYTDSQGKSHTRTVTTPGYTEHHSAENRIYTSDAGTITVTVAPNGKKLSDSYINSTAELAELWKPGTPSASTHTYENKVKASYSIYKHEEINLKDFPDLPDYPSVVKDYVYIDRIIGNVPNKDAASKKLSEINTYLNKSIDDPDKPGKKRSYKQVNIVFVNVGDKPEEYGFALQDKWQGGNKNDFVVAFSMDSENNINWVYPFTWSEVEILKLEVRDYMLDLKKIDNFVPVVEQVSKMIEEKFERKQFADFSYLSVKASTGAIIIVWIMDAVVLAITLIALFSEDTYTNRRYY